MLSRQNLFILFCPFSTRRLPAAVQLPKQTDITNTALMLRDSNASKLQGVLQYDNASFHPSQFCSISIHYSTMYIYIHFLTDELFRGDICKTKQTAAAYQAECDNSQFS